MLWADNQNVNDHISYRAIKIKINKKPNSKIAHFVVTTVTQKYDRASFNNKYE